MMDSRIEWKSFTTSFYTPVIPYRMGAVIEYDPLRDSYDLFLAVTHEDGFIPEKHELGRYNELSDAKAAFESKLWEAVLGIPQQAKQDPHKVTLEDGTVLDLPVVPHFKRVEQAKQ